MLTSIDALKNSGYIENVFGIPQKHPSIAMAVWARKMPKPPFKGMVNLCLAISGEYPTVFVDDVCTRMDTKRNEPDQQEFNKIYFNYFTALGCKVIFSSNFYEEIYGKTLFDHFLELSRQITYNDFRHCMPEEKRFAVLNLEMTEIAHFILELLLFENIPKLCNSILVGSFNQSIVLMHRSISNKPLTGYIACKMPATETEIEIYIRELLSSKKYLT